MSKEIRILLAGDTFPVESNAHLFKKGDTASLFGEKITGMFKAADYSICNLEGCLCDEGEAVDKNGPTVRADTDTLFALTELDIRAVTLANTHTLDFGRRGLDQMRLCLESAGIEHFGAGDSIDSIKTHIKTEIGGKRIIFYTVTELFNFNTPGNNDPGANGYDEYAVCRELEDLRSQCDLLIVLYHGGVEMTRFNTERIRRHFHRMADSGADIIISQHTHSSGCEEYYGNSYFLYGQGNFCFNLGKPGNPLTMSGILLEVIIGDSGFKIHKHLVRRTKTGCTYDEKQDFSDFYNRSEMHKRLFEGDEEARQYFEKGFSDYCRDKWLKVLIPLFMGNDPGLKIPDDMSPDEALKYIASKYSKKQLMAIRMMLYSDEFNEIAHELLSQLIDSKE